jgi:hypothetical protein
LSVIKALEVASLPQRCIRPAVAAVIASQLHRKGAYCILTAQCNARCHKGDITPVGTSILRAQVVSFITLVVSAANDPRNGFKTSAIRVGCLTPAAAVKNSAPAICSRTLLIVMAHSVCSSVRGLDWTKLPNFISTFQSLSLSKFRLFVRNGP